MYSIDCARHIMEFDLNVTYRGDSIAAAPYSVESSNTDIATAAAVGDEDARSSNGAASVFCSDVLGRPAEPVVDEDEAEEVGCVSPEPGIATRQLFPLAAEVAPMQPHVPVDSSSSSPLSFAAVGFWKGTTGGLAEPEANLLLQRRQVKKSRRGPRSRSSQYRGVTFYRRTGRWESHICGDSFFPLILSRDCGKQVYLGKNSTLEASILPTLLQGLLISSSPRVCFGGLISNEFGGSLHREEQQRCCIYLLDFVCRAYDRAAIKFRGLDADINFNLSDYDEDLKQVTAESLNYLNISPASAVAPQYPHLWASSCPSFFFSIEEEAEAWQISPSPLQLVSHAASSGFSTAAATTMAALPSFPSVRNH
ncbi:hypothetical protein GW17_00010853 [Ensete ventricosum]|nr:hypothetical protein GW17_00010853 [Ensete ventricosum]